MNGLKAYFFAFFLTAGSLSFAEEQTSSAPAQQEGYTINYNTVSIVEYLRFASKICNVNFIFDETNLDFTVTIVSDAPITSQNVMSTLIQTLRIHSLELLEQDNNLVIHKSPGVKQIATLATEAAHGKNAPIVTRIFRIKNAKADSIAGIIRPMISTAALLEVSAETRQLILTDVTSNVEKVASLIEILDSPHTPLDIKTYDATHNNPLYLVELCGQIMTPIAQGNPFILVPQSLANTIFIVSTPGLVDQALALLVSLDVPPKQEILTQKKLKSENIFVYKAINTASDEILKALLDISNNLHKSGIPEGDLIETIGSARSIRETNSILFVGSKDSIAKVKEFLLSLDVSSSQGSLKNSFFLYRPQNRTASDIDHALREMAHNLKGTKGADDPFIEILLNAKINSATNTLVFSGEEVYFSKIQDLLATIDTPSGKKSALPSVKHNFFLYKIQHSTFNDLQSSLKDFAKNLDKSQVGEEGLIQSIEEMKYIPEDQILFSGPDASLKRLQDLLPLFDGISSMPASNQFFIYKPVYQKGDLLANSLHEIADDLKTNTFTDSAFLRALGSMKYVKSTNSLLFTGDDPSIKRLQTLIATLDIPFAAKVPGKTFLLYSPEYATKNEVDAYIKQLSDNLDRKHEADLIDTLKSMKWIDSSRSFMFQGADASLARVKDILQNFDKASEVSSGQDFFLYPLQHASYEKTNQYIEEVADNLSKRRGANKDFIDAIRSRQWLADSGSFLFNGSPAVLQQIKELLKTFKPGYYIYKLQAANGEVVEEDLDALAKSFRASGLKDSKVLHVIDNIRYVKETNSLLLTGDPGAIDEVKAMIVEYDYPRTAPSPLSSNFFMYKPQYAPAAEIQKSLSDVASNLKKADLGDPSLLKTIDSVKYVETTNSLIFTGNADSLQKIQMLLKDIDIPPQTHAPIQHIGKTTFLLYKLKHAEGSQIVVSIKSMTADLKKSGTGDKDLIAALSSMKYIKETNSLLFTGNDEALKKAQTLIEHFDVASLGALSAGMASNKPLPVESSNFFLYKPQSIPGPDLEKLMSDFAEHLKLSGLTDPDLFNAIMSMRYVEKTQSLIFTGTAKSLEQVKSLLKEFDIPSNLHGGKPAAPLEPSIQAVDNTSFLVYKLQFHKGDEIQSALRQIAKDLMAHAASAAPAAPVNQGLLSSINSIQWLDVTNSLLCSGDQETLTRLKELIKNLDIPLKQVFIDMLVIETTLTNALNFGLEWGGNYKFNKRFGIGSFNTLPPVNTQSAFPDTFINNLSRLNPPSPPTPVGNIPPVSGFDLGVIGEVIKHNGDTFLTIGSLLSALQNDIETTIITAPKILAQDGRTSTIFSGANIPFTGSFVNNTQSGATIQTSNLEYRDIGLNLTITPVLGNSDIVTLDINLDRTQTATDITQTTLNFNTQTANGIVTSKTTMTTTVHVPDRNFLILSGFVNNSNTKQKAGIPCLGGLPLIGAAFSQANDTISSQSVVIFLRPYIVNSIDDMRALTSAQEDMFRDQMPTPFLQHNYDEAVELIKTIEDD